VANIVDLVPAVYAAGDLVVRPDDGLMILPGDTVHVIPELVDVPGSPYVTRVTKTEGARLAKLARNLTAGLAGGPLED
jgi:hypothetical protein